MKLSSLPLSFISKISNSHFFKKKSTENPSSNTPNYNHWSVSEKEKVTPHTGNSRRSTDQDKKTTWIKKLIERLIKKAPSENKTPKTPSSETLTSNPNQELKADDIAKPAPIAAPRMVKNSLLDFPMAPLFQIKQQDKELFQALLSINSDVENFAQATKNEAFNKDNLSTYTDILNKIEQKLGSQDLKSIEDADSAADFLNKLKSALQIYRGMKTPSTLQQPKPQVPPRPPKP